MKKDRTVLMCIMCDKKQIMQCKLECFGGDRDRCLNFVSCIAQDLCAGKVDHWSLDEVRNAGLMHLGLVVMKRPAASSSGGAPKKRPAACSAADDSGLSSTLQVPIASSDSQASASQATGGSSEKAASSSTSPSTSSWAQASASQLPFSAPEPEEFLDPAEVLSIGSQTDEF